MEDSGVIRKGVSNIKYSVLAHALVMIAGIIKALVVPGVLSVEGYAYWQIFSFYLSYIGFFYLGFNDGILLSYGGYSYDALPFKRLRRAMQMYIVMLFGFFLVLWSAAGGIGDVQRVFIMKMLAVNVVLGGMNGVLIYVFLLTNQIRRYSIFSSIEQGVVLLGVGLLFITKFESYRVLVYATVVSRVCVVGVMMWMQKEFFIGEYASFQEGFEEFTKNVKSGIFLMLAQVMGMLLTGLGRIFVEYFGNIDEYAYYAFGMSVVSVVMVFVSAVSTVAYPTLCRVQTKRLPYYFDRLCVYTTLFSFLGVLAYFPAYWMVAHFFENYTPLLSYLYLFFCMLIWQAKMSILTNCYFRVLRKEKRMSVINVWGTVFFCVIALPAILMTRQIDSIALCTYLTMVFMEVVCEGVLRRQLGLGWGRALWYDAAVNGVFLVCARFLPFGTGFLLYGAIVAGAGGILGPKYARRLRHFLNRE